MNAIETVKWRLVIVESPFAPQTKEDHECLKNDIWGYYCCTEGHRISDVRKEESTRNARYLAACLSDCIRRGESPYASHGLLTLPGVLNDTRLEERARGIAAGFAWRRVAAASVFYTDLGWSSGMRAGHEDAKRVWGRDRSRLCLGDSEDHSAVHQIEERQLGEGWDK